MQVLSRGAACVGSPLEREMRMATLPTATSRCAGSSWPSISAQSISVASDGCGEGRATRTQPKRGTTPRGGRTCVRLTETNACVRFAASIGAQRCNWVANQRYGASSRDFLLRRRCLLVAGCLPHHAQSLVSSAWQQRFSRVMSLCWNRGVHTLKL
jgi:hypothetical protein